MDSINWLAEGEARKGELLKSLGEILSIPSIKNLETASKDRPMGENVGKALETMLKFGTEAGFRVKNIDGYAGYIEYGKSEEYIGVLAHVDVVPADPTEWDTPPFEATTSEGKLYARGAIDDKGPAIAVFYALKLLKELNLPLKKRIRLIFGTDEESGMRCIRHYMDVEENPKFGFSPDADFPIIYAEKGQMNVKIKNDSHKDHFPPDGDTVLQRFHSGERGNMVPGTAVAVLKTMDHETITSAFADFLQNNKLAGDTQVTAPDLIQLTLYGKTVHGMEPQNGRNAALESIRFLDTLALTDKDKTFTDFCYTYLFRDPFGEKLDIDYSEETLGKLTVNAGIFHYTPEKGAEISLNIRCPLKTNYMRTVEIIEEKVAPFDLYVDEVRQKQPHYVNPHHPMIKVMQESYESIIHGEPTLLTTGGATYARFLNNGVAYGAVFPGKEMTAHQANEYIEIDDLLRATAIYAKALYKLSQM